MYLLSTSLIKQRQVRATETLQTYFLLCLTTLDLQITIWMRKLGLPTYTEIVRRRGSDLWRVRVGRFATEDDAKRALDILALNAISNGGVHTESK